MTRWGQAVGICGRIERSLRRGHVLFHIVKNLFCNPFKIFVTGHLVPFKIGHDQQGIVIEHFLKMGDKPLFVRRIPVKTAPYMIIDAACRHLFK